MSKAKEKLERVCENTKAMSQKQHDMSGKVFVSQKVYDDMAEAFCKKER